LSNPYLEQVNKKETNPLLVSFRAFAEANKVPIITYEGLQFLIQVIKLRNVKNVLEIGSAIGYSSISMALATNCKVTTIERDLSMVKLARENIIQANVDHLVTLIHQDALEIDETTLGTFDMIFIDAAKAQSIKFFEKFETCLSDKGVIVTDNLLFHDLVNQEVRDRNLRQLLTKIDRFNQYVANRQGYHTYIYNLGDGMSLSIKE
jgi:predicted O-methyltransferase YrrM